MLNKNDPLIGAVQEVMKKNQAEREAVKLVNEKFGVSDRKALPHERQGEWDAAYKTVLTEGLHPNQQKLDVHEPEKDKLTKHDFKMLRAKKKPMEEGSDVTSPSSMGIKKPDYASGTPDYAKSKEQTVNRAAKTSLPAGTMKEEEQIQEKAPPGAKYERMVKHIKSKMAKGGLTKKEKSIAYATAWKAKKKSDVNEGFNNRHDLSVTASDENQVVADQLNEAGGIYNPNLLSPKTAVVPKKKIPTPFPDRETGVASNRNYKSQVAKTLYTAKRLTGKANAVKPTGELKDGGNFYANKYKDKAETFARAATGDIGDLVGLTNPERGAALRKFNPGAAQAGDLAGAASMLLPGRAPTAAVSTAAKVKQGTSIVPKIAKAEGQGARIAGRRPGINAGPWGTPSTAAAKTAATSAEKYKARVNAMRRQVAGASEVKPAQTATAKASPIATPNAAAANAAKVARSSARPATPNAAASNASRIRMAVNKAVNTSLNTARLVGGPNGPSSGSSFGAPSPAAAATTSPTVKARQQLAAIGNQTGGVNKITNAGATTATPPAKPAPAPASKPTATKTKPAAPAAQPVRKAAPQDSSTPAQRAQYNRQVDKNSVGPSGKPSAYKGLGVTSGTTVKQKPMAPNKNLPGGK